MNVWIKRQHPHITLRLIFLPAAVVCLAALSVFSSPGCSAAQKTVKHHADEVVTVNLPEAVYDSAVSIEKTIQQRRSSRDFNGEPLSLRQVSQLLWAAQGITGVQGLRTAPSAGALYPLEVYLVAGSVDGLHPGIYRYKPAGHRLMKTVDGDKRTELSAAAFGQSSVKNASIIIVFTAIYERTTQKYGDRGIRYVHIEAGHAAQNICLQATAMNLKTVPVGSFNDNQVKDCLNIPGTEQAVYIIPAGT